LRLFFVFFCCSMSFSTKCLFAPPYFVRTVVFNLWKKIFLVHATGLMHSAVLGWDFLPKKMKQQKLQTAKAAEAATSRSVAVAHEHTWKRRNDYAVVRTQHQKLFGCEVDTLRSESFVLHLPIISHQRLVDFVFSKAFSFLFIGCKYFMQNLRIGNCLNDCNHVIKIAVSQLKCFEPSTFFKDGIMQQSNQQRRSVPCNVHSVHLLAVILQFTRSYKLSAGKNNNSLFTSGIENRRKSRALQLADIS